MNVRMVELRAGVGDVQCSRSGRSNTRRTRLGLLLLLPLDPAPLILQPAPTSPKQQATAMRANAMARCVSTLVLVALLACTRTLAGEELVVLRPNLFPASKGVIVAKPVRSIRANNSNAMRMEHARECEGLGGGRRHSFVIASGRDLTPLGFVPTRLVCARFGSSDEVALEMPAQCN